MSKGNCGDRIRVVDAETAETGETYKNGDKGTIGKTKYGWSGAEVRFDHQNDNDQLQYLCGYEYEIIEDSEEKITEQEIPWEVGQEVWCILRGKGYVCSVENNISLWTSGVTVDFDEHGTIRYGIDGKVSGGMNRSLYFSEPKITAELLPPKKLFVPVLKKGEIVIAVNKIDGSNETFVVSGESENNVESSFGSGNISYIKAAWNFYKIGDMVNFNV